MAHLFELFKEPCVLLEKRTMSDGQGGYTHEWRDGVTFRAAVIKNETLAARVAEKQGVTEVYQVYADEELELDFHDVFRRVKDGATFRVTSNAHDSRTPDVATFSFSMVTAERWTLT